MPDLDEEVTLLEEAPIELLRDFSRRINNQLYVESCLRYDVDHKLPKMLQPERSQFLQIGAESERRAAVLRHLMVAIETAQKEQRRATCTPQ